MAERLIPGVGYYSESVQGQYLIPGIGYFSDPGSNATAVLLSGPSGGRAGIASSNFLVSLNGIPASAVVVTPADAGAGGTFTPTTVTLSSAISSATFTYTPSSVGVKAISLTNDLALSNPSAINYSATLPSVTFTLGSVTGVAAASLAGLKWAWFDQVTPDLFLAPTDKGAIEETDASGVISIVLTNSVKTSGQLGAIVITDSDGTFTQHKAFYSPLAVD